MSRQPLDTRAANWPRRRRVAVVFAILAGATAALPGGAAGASIAVTHQSVHDKAELHLVRAFGETLQEEGAATGTLPGTVHIRLDINAAQNTATAIFTTYVHGGTISGRSSGSAHGGQGGWESFTGTMKIERGTGRYAHASGSVTMSGAIYRRTDRLIVQENGQIHY